MRVMVPGNLLIVQGGGPTPVFNASLAAIVGEALTHPRFGKIFGAHFGMMGLAAGELLDLSQLSSDALRELRNSPGAALGSSRFKPTKDDLLHIVELVRAREIRYIVFMGGNGTMGGAARFSDLCRAHQLDVQIIGVPKTIDNDLAATDRCPGFGSAGRFVAQSTLDLAMDIRSLPQPVSIFETLGRDVGWIAASATLAKRSADDAPHLVYVPEIPFSQDGFLSAVDDVVRRIGWAVVIVSEGTRYADGQPVFEQTIAGHNGTPNRPLIGGVAQYLSGLVGEQLGIRCRSEKPGLIGRSSRANVSAQDLQDADLVGREGVRALLAGATDQMVALREIGAADGAATELVPLQRVGGHRRAIPEEWLSTDGLAVTDAFRSYARPLIGELTMYPDPFRSVTRRGA